MRRNPPPPPPLAWRRVNKQDDLRARALRLASTWDHRWRQSDPSRRRCGFVAPGLTRVRWTFVFFFFYLLFCRFLIQYWLFYSTGKTNNKINPVVILVADLFCKGFHALFSPFFSSYFFCHFVLILFISDNDGSQATASDAAIKTEAAYDHERKKKNKTHTL